MISVWWEKFNFKSVRIQYLQILFLTASRCLTFSSIVKTDYMEWVGMHNLYNLLTNYNVCHFSSSYFFFTFLLLWNTDVGFNPFMNERAKGAISSNLGMAKNIFVCVRLSDLDSDLWLGLISTKFCIQILGCKIFVSSLLMGKLLKPFWYGGHFKYLKSLYFYKTSGIIHTWFLQNNPKCHGIAYKKCTPKSILNITTF